MSGRKTCAQADDDGCDSHRTIGIVNLDVAGMVSNRKLARAISNMGFFEFRRQLEYEAKMNGAKVPVVALELRVWSKADLLALVMFVVDGGKPFSSQATLP